MSSARIEQALARATETAAFEVAPGLLRRVAEIYQQWFDTPAVVIADDHTFAAAGREVHERLVSAGIRTLDPFIFPGTPMLHGDHAHVLEIRAFLEPTDATPVAVGSGTINDIVKRAAGEVERPYMVVGTAASVDGYSSFGAALTQDGFKKTMECPAPLVVLADIDVLREAPPEMTAAGYADLASKITAGADWVIADFLGVDPIDPVGWDMVQTDLRRWLGDPGGLAAGQREPFENLFEGLTMTGFAMQALRKSRPASGADHLFAHIWEMEGLECDGVPVSHGFKVAIGTLASTAMMEAVLARDIGTLDIDRTVAAYPSWSERERDIQAAFGGTQAIERVLDECRAKQLNEAALRERLELVRDGWEDLRERTLAQLYPYAELRRLFVEAKCPVRPDQIELSRERVRDTAPTAQLIRNRYTVLDLAFELGWLEECAAELASSDVFLC